MATPTDHGVDPSIAVLDRVLVLETVRITEAAALAAAELIGRGDEKAADAAAVQAMRRAFDSCPFDGEVVIGEGERDEAPMLFIGERVGGGGDDALRVDIAVDPLEGTTIAAKGGANALAVLAIAGRGGFLNAPDLYMRKMAIGPHLAAAEVSLNDTPSQIVAAIAKARGVDPSQVTTCVLERDRHEDLIAELRASGARVLLISDGDVAASIATADPKSGIDVYLGTGGAPEGVLAAAALKCLGGRFEGKLICRNEDERARAARLDVTDFDKVYTLDDLVRGDAIFAATGVTGGNLLDGVEMRDGKVTTHTIVMRASSGTVREVRGRHTPRAVA